MLFDFEPPTTSTPTKLGAAATRELHTPVKLITFSTLGMATSPFAHHETLHPLQTTTKTHKCHRWQLTYSNLLSKIK